MGEPGRPGRDHRELSQSLETLYLYCAFGNQLNTLQVSQEVLENLTARLLENMELDLAFARVFDLKEYRALAASEAFSRMVPRPDRFLDALLTSIPADTHSRADNYFIVNHSTDVPGYRELHADPYRFLAVPVQHDQAFYGWLGILSFRMDEIFRRTDLNLLGTIAEQLGAVITNTRKTDELVTLNRKMQAEIEERKRAQEELTRAFEELQVLDRAKDAFLSSVSHELRTPLTSIRSFSEILLTYEDTAAEDRREFLKIVLSESDRLKRLVDDLLDLSKIEAGKVVWNDERICLNQVVRDVADAQQALLLERSLRFVPDLSEDLPVVRADRDRIQQVLTNLVGNAVKFSPDGGEIRVRTEALQGRRAGESSCWVKVSVTDHGTGVDARDFKSIFDKFCQGSSDTLTEKPQGTGLGLPISREIVAHYGGNIWVESEKGKGSTFSFTLPEAQGPDELHRSSLPGRPAGPGRFAVPESVRPLSRRV